MESLANYGSDDEIDSGTISNVNNGFPNPCSSGLEGDNYDDVQMDMSENPLNGSKAPSVQAFPQGRVGGALPNCATIVLDSNCDSIRDDEDKSTSEQHEAQSSSPSSPISASSSNSSESTDKKPSAPTQGSETASEKRHSNSQVRPKHDKKDQEPHRDKRREREAEERERERREGRRRYDRHRSRSRSRDRKEREKERRRTPERRRSRERDDRRRSRERPSPIREHKRREVDRRSFDSRSRDHDRKRHRSRSHSPEKLHGSSESRRSSSSSGSNKSDARSRDKVQPSSLKRISRSRSRSAEKERHRVGDSRKFFLEKKLDRKMNVLERMGIELKAEAKLGSPGLVTPQMLVQRTMEQQAAQVKQATGVELPSYYNAAAVNAHRLVDQIQKRKLLWGSKKEEQANPASTQLSSKWQGATFAQDQDGKLTAKFNRLMGIKQPTAETSSPVTGETKGSEIIKKQEEMFHNMESQYEVARLATHTHRGLGLGFGTFQPR